MTYNVIGAWDVKPCSIYVSIYLHVSIYLLKDKTTYLLTYLLTFSKVVRLWSNVVYINTDECTGTNFRMGQNMTH